MDSPGSAQRDSPSRPRAGGLRALVSRAVEGALGSGLFGRPRYGRDANRLAGLEPGCILVSRPDHIGDVILTTPALRHLRQRYPQAHIVAVVGSWSADVIAGTNLVDRIIVLDCPWWRAKRSGRPAWLSWGPFLWRCLRLRRLRADLFLDFRGDLRHIVFLGVLGGSRYRVAFDRTGGAAVLDAPVPFDASQHDIVRNLGLLSVLGPVPNPPPRVEIACDPADESWADGLLPPRAAEDRRVFVLLHPSAKRVNRWPVERFADVVARLVAEFDALIFVTGLAEDEADAAVIRAAAPERVRSLCGQTGMRRMASLIARADLLLCADTGPMHLVNASGTPSVVLFGPTPAARFAPLVGDVTVIAAARCCREELHETCDWAPGAAYSACMETLDVDAVYAAVAGSLRRTLARRPAAAGRADGSRNHRPE